MLSWCCEGAKAECIEGTGIGGGGGGGGGGHCFHARLIGASVEGPITGKKNSNTLSPSGSDWRYFVCASVLGA